MGSSLACSLRASFPSPWPVFVLASSSLIGCSAHNETSQPNTSEPPYLSQDALMDPASCASCHPAHVQQWSISMHAYASDDPVFLAMNARAQRETQGAVGSFCVQCHAPLALRMGATTDGTNLAHLPSPLRGITCYFCHTADSVQGIHNNPIHLAEDNVLRGAIANPAPGATHKMAYSALHDRTQLGSSALCGSCHDIHTQAGVDVAQTYVEWQKTLFAHTTQGQELTCSNCHMPGSDGVAAQVMGAPKRQVHDHSMPAVDIALTPFTGTAVQKNLVQNNLDPSLVAKLCVKPYHGGPNVDVILDNAFAGHAFPSGASYDRRVWVELIAYAKQQVVYQSGVVPDNRPALDSTDPNLWLFRTQLFDSKGHEARFQWEATSATPAFLSPAVTNNPRDPAYYHSLTHSYRVPVNVDRITMRVRIMPISLEVLDDLVASGDLNPLVRSAVPIYTLAGTQLEWTAAQGFACVPTA